MYGALPDAGEFLGDVGQALAVVPRAAAAEAFPLLYEQVKQSRYPLSPSETLGVLILAMMLNPPPERKWSAAALTREQRLAIRLVADRAWTLYRGVPTIHGNLADLLENVGLPRKREEIFALLAGTPEGGADAARGEEVVVPQTAALVEGLVRLCWTCVSTC